MKTPAEKGVISTEIGVIFTVTLKGVFLPETIEGSFISCFGRGVSLHYPQLFLPETIESKLQIALHKL
ncbi:MAG: hypothetical protein EOM64_03745 [Erysipelotrichia bacterium]|nr:hypothetical protein [Erysipelotrichia bacterium]